MKDLLPSRTAISPDVPRRFASLLSSFPDLRAFQTLILPIIPLTDCFCDFNLGSRSDRLILLRVSSLLPRQFFFAANPKKFERSSCAETRRDVAFASRPFIVNEINSISVTLMLHLGWKKNARSFESDIHMD